MKKVGYDIDELFPIGCVVEEKVMKNLPEFIWKPVAMIVLPILENESTKSASASTKIPIEQMPSHSFGEDRYTHVEKKPSFFQRTY